MAEIADLESVKVLANPLRQRILRELNRSGPATSTMLARELGVTSGGTSYNLRVLADHGFVREVPERGNGRERWWQAAGTDLRFPRHSEQSAEMQEAMGELNRLWFAQDQEAFARFLRHRSELGEWGDALPYSRGTLRVTPEELLEFFERYLELLMSYSRPDEEVPPDARTILTYFVGFPDVGE